MPIVVKLSQAFYDRFGDAVADELVAMVNQVDAGSQQSMRELMAANFARFDARCERRLADLRVEIVGENAKLESRLSGRMVSQLPWMIGMWVAVLLALIGLWWRH